ncbi:hypothetical protein Daura_49735 [Dactylosporangium aurantiacum]|uniref:Uncharacterized protein n=1 Tax=Dactylosporangium aurantiacum TaxID=35754 RepID=A0A9Q9IJX4_9ACTN|nr:hypothetical protein [Dactylosporangium aurantiacum]MDG6107441.1 hypothetical protein [Dactylosporangium aurantiacum]UWZ54433.1 hypothetical protein Daura_49735 [Dactylosporangium aurantiacum]
MTTARHTPRHRRASRTSTALRTVRWLRLLHPRPFTAVDPDPEPAAP